MRLAIVGGIADYKNQTVLDACKNDADTLRKFLDATNAYSDICFLAPNTTGGEAKNIIAAFVEKHRSDKVEELFFYFSGHGDRTEDDFFYAFSDYKAERKESTGLRNSELDALIRNFSPELTIKIVDACYAGSTYIKSDDDITPIVQKSAKENELKKLYFLYSSEGNQASWAGSEFSHFTLAIFQSLAEQSGPVRYRDLMAAVADEMHSSGAPKPTFVVQADNLEIFVHMDAPLSEILLEAIGIIHPAPTDSSVKRYEDVAASNVEILHSLLTPPKPLSLAELAEIKSREIYCTEEEANESIRILESNLNNENWPRDILDAYEIEVSIFGEDAVPNKLAIAKWIKSLTDDSVFAVLTFEKQKYTVEEYKEVPKKPVTGSFGMGSMAQLQKLFGDDKQFKLESVTKEMQVVSGFQYTVDPVAFPRQLRFCPKHTSLEHYAATLVFLFSRRALTCLYAIEHLPYTGWGKAQPAKASQWKQLTVPLKNHQRILTLATTVISEISDFVRIDARQRLS